MAIYPIDKLGVYTHTKPEHFSKTYNARLDGQVGTYVDRAKFSLDKDIAVQAKREKKIQKVLPGNIYAQLPNMFGSPSLVIDRGQGIEVVEIGEKGLPKDAKLVSRHRADKANKKGQPGHAEFMNEMVEGAMGHLRGMKFSLGKALAGEPDKLDYHLFNYAIAIEKAIEDIDKVIQQFANKRGINVDAAEGMAQVEGLIDRIKRLELELVNKMQSKPKKSELEGLANAQTPIIAGIFGEIFQVYSFATFIEGLQNTGKKSKLMDVEIKSGSNKAVDSVAKYKKGKEEITIGIQSKATSYHQVVQRYGATLRQGTGIGEYVLGREIEPVIGYIMGNLARFRYQDKKVGINNYLDYARIALSGAAEQLTREDSDIAWDFFFLSDAVYAKSAILRAIYDSLDSTQGRSGHLLHVTIEKYATSGGKGESVIGSDFDERKVEAIWDYKYHQGIPRQQDIRYTTIRNQIGMSSSQYRAWARTILNDLKYKVKLRGHIPHSSQGFK